METLNTKPIGEMTPEEIEIYLKGLKDKEKEETERKKKDYLNDKDSFLTDLATRYQELHSYMSNLKKEGIDKAENFNKLKYDLEGKPFKEAKSFELKNESYRVIVETQERFDFTDEAVVHINAIKDIFRKKFEERNKGFYNLLDGILMKNSKGEYDAKLLTKARRQVKELGDEALIAEFDKLTDCQVVTGTAKYIRMYVRENGKWNDVSLNFSSL